MGGYQILGGSSPLNQYFERIYNNLVPHNFTTIMIVMWLIDVDAGQATDQRYRYHYTVDSTTIPGPLINDDPAGDRVDDQAGLTNQKDLGYDYVKITVRHTGPSWRPDGKFCKFVVYL